MHVQCTHNFSIKLNGFSNYACVSYLEYVFVQVSKNEIKIAWGTGIVGYVAQTGESCNVTDCYKDSR